MKHLQPVAIRPAQDLWFPCLLIPVDHDPLRIGKADVDGVATHRPDHPGVMPILRGVESWPSNDVCAYGEASTGVSVTLPGHPIVMRGPVEGGLLQDSGRFPGRVHIGRRETSCFGRSKQGHCSRCFGVTVAYPSPRSAGMPWSSLEAFLFEASPPGSSNHPFTWMSAHAINPHPDDGLLSGDDSVSSLSSNDRSTIGPWPE